MTAAESVQLKLGLSARVRPPEMEKLTGQVMAHIPGSAEKQLKGLAMIEGVKPSEYVRDLIMTHLREKQRQSQLMHEVFGSDELDQND